MMYHLWVRRIDFLQHFSQLTREEKENVPDVERAARRPIVNS